VGAANRVGGDDNITVVCFRLGGEDTSVTQALDIDPPTEENALPEAATLSGLDRATTAVVAGVAEAEEEPEAEEELEAEPPAAPEPSPPSRGLFAPAILILAIGAIALLVWLVLR
jgi:hypothetical protein